MSDKSNDEYWMTTALLLADECKGLTRPNPPVASVIIKNGEMVGSGYHPKAGEPHAEIFALKEAGDNAKDATLYVTLEPCSTSGRTPPCTQAIIDAGIKRVVYGCDDPNPVHAGKGAAILKRKGIEVTRNILQDECSAVIAPFAKLITEGRPYVTLKLASTLDGRIADASGTSKWITGPEAREAVQELRRSADAIMVGAETLRKDDPSLLPRPAWGRKPYRVIMAGEGRIPKKAKVFTDSQKDQTLLFQNKQPKTVLKELAKLDCMHVLCEGGGKLAGSLIKQNLVDEIHVFFAPKILGGKGRPSVAGGWKLADAPEFEFDSVEQFGRDVLLTLKRGV